MAKRFYEHTENDQLEMMRNPSRWPYLYLPVKHSTRREGGENGFPLLGVMFEDNAKGQAAPKVYVGCVGIGDIKHWPVEEYFDLAAVVCAGWIVD